MAQTEHSEEQTTEQSKEESKKEFNEGPEKGSSEQSPLRRRLRVEAADSKLLFVGFALLIMVIGPIITGVVINFNEQELLATVDRAQRQVRTLRPVAPPVTAGVAAAPRRESGETQATLDSALREQEHAKATIYALHDIQDCVIAVFGLLGLVAAFYSRRALQDTRALLRDLEAERAKMSAVFNTTNVGITLWDSRGRLLDSNPAALLILGQPSEEELRRQMEPPSPVSKGNAVSTFLAPLDAQGRAMPPEQWPQGRALRGETFYDQEVGFTRPDGARVLTLFGGCPGMRGPDGRVTLGVNVFRDVTAQREGERQFHELAQADARRARTLESLFETAGHLSVSASPAEMHAYLTRHVAGVLQATRAALWSYDAVSNTLRPLLPSWGFEDAQLADVSVTVEPGEWAHDLLFGNATLRSNAVAGESDGVLYRQLREWHVASVLAVPLIAHGQPVGILCTCDKQQDTDSGQGFTEQDDRVLRTFAGQAAFALHSAQQYARAHARSEELAALARITRVLVNSLEMETIVPAFLQEVRALIPYGAARLVLLAPATEDRSWSQEYPDDDDEETDLLRRLRGKPARSAQSGTSAAIGSAGTNMSLNKGQNDAIAAQGVNASRLSAAVKPLSARVWTIDASLPLPSRMAGEERLLDAGDPLRRILEAGAHAAASAGQAASIGVENAGMDETNSDETDAGAANSGAMISEGVIAIPLIVQRHLLGVLEFKAAQTEEGSRRVFGENHLALARQAAGQFAAATQNAQSYAEATRRAEQLQWAMEETHHRIKNNLQAVISILDLYRMEAEDAGRQDNAHPAGQARSNVVSQDGLTHAMREVRTIAAVHDLLSEDIHNSRVNARHMLDSLVPLLLTASVTEGRRVHTEIIAQDISLPSKMVSALALAANELIVNSVRHGGRGRRELRLQVELKRLPGSIELTVADDGPGFAPGFDPQKNAKIGLGLTRTLIERDFKGKLTFANQNERGEAVVTASVPYRD